MSLLPFTTKALSMYAVAVPAVPATRFRPMPVTALKDGAPPVILKDEIGMRQIFQVASANAPSAD
jgi:hypothetical protein